MSIQSIVETAQDQVQEGIEPEAIATLVSIISSSSTQLEHFSSNLSILDAAKVCVCVCMRACVRACVRVIYKEAHYYIAIAELTNS